MARKKKKKAVKNNKQRAQRQQKKQQRRTKRVHEYSGGHTNKSGKESPLIDDMLDLFPYANDPNPPDPESIMEKLFFSAADTAHLITEPEFDDVGFDPLTTPTLFSEASIKLGFEDIEAIDEDKQFDAFTDIIEEIIEDLLEDGVREEIIDAVDSLRIRLKKSKRRREDVTRLAALQFVLTSDGEDDTTAAWPAMGLVQALIQRTLGVGLELMNVLSDLPEAPELVAALLAESDSTATADNPIQELIKRIEKSPLLNRFMTNQYDDIWDEGVAALSEGKIGLDIFSEGELEAAEEIFLRAQLASFIQMGLKLDADDLSDLDEEAEREFTLFLDNINLEQAQEISSKIFFPQYVELIDEIFSTNARREKLSTYLERSVTERLNAKSGWGAFLVQAKDLLDDEPDEFVDSEFLLRALLGQLKPLLMGADEEG